MAAATSFAVMRSLLMGAAAFFFLLAGMALAGVAMAASLTTGRDLADRSAVTLAG